MNTLEVLLVTLLSNLVGISSVPVNLRVSFKRGRCLYAFAKLRTL